MVWGRRTIWLPDRLKRRDLGATITQKAIPFILRRIRQVEHYSRPRGVRIFENPWAMRVIGLLLIACAIGAAFAPPFTGLDTLPALGAVAIALSVILEDVVVLVVGIVLGTGGVVLIVTVGAALLTLVRKLF
jgi:hypothetical protein